MFFDRLNEGGPFFMYSLLIVFIVIVLLFVQALIKKDTTSKNRKLIGHFSLFAVAWGFAGQIMGLITAFDVLEMAAEISPQVMASGLKVSFLAPLFGLIIAIIGRMEIIFLTWRSK